MPADTGALKTMRFDIGDRIIAGQREFAVTGCISYRGNDGSSWDEYALRGVSGMTSWLSVDDAESEYILSETAGTRNPPPGFTIAWQGTERVTGVSGAVDVEPDDEAECWDYEDSGNRVFSVERWEDETECSLGTYLKPQQIRRISGGNAGGLRYQGWAGPGPLGGRVTQFISEYGPTLRYFSALLIVVFMASLIFNSGKQDVNSYLDSNPDKYTRVTSLTSPADNDARASVYKSAAGWAGGGSPHAVADDIVTNCTDEFTRIRKNDIDPDDGSVSMLTRGEYIFIYRDADAGSVLVEVEPRKYSYRSVPGPYHSSMTSERFYRAFYHHYAYPEDLSAYGRGGSPYESYSPVYELGSSYDHSLETKAASIRQGSINRRRSSGGAIHYGK